MKKLYHTKHSALAKISGLLLTLLLGGCLSDGSELIPAEENAVRVSGLTVGIGVTPTYTWNVGPISSLNVVRLSDPTNPVWGFSVFNDTVSSPVTHGNIPSGAQGVGGSEPILTAGIQYRVLIERRTEGRSFTAFFTPPDGTVTSTIPAALSSSAAGAHALALTANGTPWSWGANGSGQLGTATAGAQGAPQAPGLTQVVAVAAGGAHSLAVTADGAVWSWGANGSGQLGGGGTADSAVPLRVRGLSGVTAVAAGERHSLALTAGGAVWAWGENSSSQLGDGTTVNRDTPVQVGFLGKIAAIAAGKLHSMALAQDGTVWSWGGNYQGQLGDGSAANAAAPVQVHAP